MSGKELKKKKKVSEVLSWQQKKEQADLDEDAIKKDVDELVSWTTRVESMNDKQLTEYVMNRANSQQNVKAVESAPAKKARMSGKARLPSSSSLGIMASVWKFHKEDDEEAALTIPI